MLDFVFCCSLFACGIIAACVDWNNFMSNIFKFDDYVKSARPILDDDTGLPTGRTEIVMVENTFDPRIIIVIFFILVLFFFIIIYLPAKILFEHLESKSIAQTTLSTFDIYFL